MTDMKVLRNEKKFDNIGEDFGDGSSTRFVLDFTSVGVFSPSDSSLPASAFSCRSRMTRSLRAAFLASRASSRACCASSSFRFASSSSFFFWSARNSTSSATMKGTICLAASRQSLVVRHGPVIFSRAGCSGLPLRSK